MDSLSQIVLGASVAVLVAKTTKNRRVIFWAALLATLPDLDIFFPAENELALALAHRTWTHSWVVQSLLAPLASWIIYKMDKTLSHIRWCLVTWMVWVTHSALDAFTVYGTHLFWPFNIPSTFISNIFIVDPLYTLPFLLFLFLAFFSKQKWTIRWVSVGLIISNIYLVWTLCAQKMILDQAKRELKSQNLTYNKIFTSPTYFNSFLWRVVALSEEAYHEAFVSIFDETPEVKWKTHQRNLSLLSSLGQRVWINKVKFFSHGYYAAQVEGKKNSLRIVDLRLGWSGNYYFRYQVGTRLNRFEPFKSVKPQHISSRPLPGELQRIWKRIWTEPW